MTFPHTPQLDARDCGPACLHTIARHHGKRHSLPVLREYCHINREGVSLLGISDAAEKIGFRTMGVKRKPSATGILQQPFLMISSIRQ
jgi:ATP-binding cassette subfamily B protein